MHPCFNCSNWQQELIYVNCNYLVCCLLESEVGCSLTCVAEGFIRGSWQKGAEQPCFCVAILSSVLHMFFDSVLNLCQID